MSDTMTRPDICTDKLRPEIAALMSAAAAQRWCVVLDDGRPFYLHEAQARRFHAANAGSVLFPPTAGA